MSTLRSADPEIAEAIAREEHRQFAGLELIASENYVSPMVLEAQGSVLTNKYAEGLPHKRYYGGCEFVDEAELLAIKRAKELFGADAVNVQPHSGAQANMAVFFAALEPGDTYLGMDLAHGGHLTHGSPVNFSGRLYDVVPYGVHPETHRLEFDQIRALAKKHRPKLIICGASAYPRAISFESFRAIADEVGARLMADIAHPAGLIAAKLHPDPVPYCDYVTTTTHKTLRGPRGGMVMCRKKFAKKLNSRVFPGMQGGPLMHTIAAKAVAFREALQPSFVTYAQQVIDNAQTLAECLIEGGLDLVSGGTDTHLLLIDLTRKQLTGKLAEEALGAAGITTNKNTVPNETRSPFVTSGVRIGTPAITTRGMKQAEMRQIAKWILEVIEQPESEHVRARVRAQVLDLCAHHPVLGNSRTEDSAS